jgi:uncharacterized protein (TIGR03086 family)
VDAFGALDIATAGFARTLALVQPGQWAAPTPNPGWSVRDLVNHVVGGNRRYVLLLSGAPTEDVEALRELDHLGDDPIESFRATAATVAAAFAERGVLERVVHHRRGDRYGAELLVMRIGEHALHGWDLARAIGADPSIDEPVVETLLAAAAADPTSIERAGYAALPGADNLDGVARLLALTGRG